MRADGERHEFCVRERENAVKSRCRYVQVRGKTRTREARGNEEERERVQKCSSEAREREKCARGRCESTATKRDSAAQNLQESPGKRRVIQEKRRRVKKMSFRAGGAKAEMRARREETRGSKSRDRRETCREKKIPE